jgi:hypothetical protein
MDDIADLQAQLVALRLAVEGAWLSLLGNDANPVGMAGELKRANVAAVDQLDATTANARSLRDAVATHTAHLWGSIEWQLQQIAQDRQ